MPNEYARWMRERELEAAALRGIQLPQPRESTIAGDVLVPALQGTVIGVSLGIVASGLMLICGAKWAASWRWGAALGLCVFGLTVIAFILHHHGASTFDPIRLAYKRFEQARPPEPPPVDDEPWRVINPRRGPKMIPATLDAEVTSIEPPVDPTIRRLYEFIIRTWPNGPSVSRRQCADLGFSRKTWEKYVGGVRGKEGQESGRGLLDRAGIVHRTSNGWQICAGLQDALTINADLTEYAESKARLVVGRDGLGVGRDNQGGASHLSQPIE